MCFRKEGIDATEIARESKVSGIGWVGFSTYAFRKPKLSLAANGAHW